MHSPCTWHLGADGGAGDVATALMPLRASSLAGVVSNRSYDHHIKGTLSILFSFACVNQCIYVHWYKCTNVSPYVYSCIYVYLYPCMCIFVWLSITAWVPVPMRVREVHVCSYICVHACLSVSVCLCMLNPRPSWQTLHNIHFSTRAHQGHCERDNYICAWQQNSSSAITW